jgi:hypothetical protein
VASPGWLITVMETGAGGTSALCPRPLLLGQGGQPKTKTRIRPSTSNGLRRGSTYSQVVRPTGSMLSSHPTAALASIRQGLFNDPRIAVHQRQQHPSRSRRRAMALFPVAEGCHRNADTARKGRLGEARLSPNGRYIELARHLQGEGRNQVQLRNALLLGLCESFGQPSQEPLIIVISTYRSVLRCRHIRQ